MKERINFTGRINIKKLTLEGVHCNVQFSSGGTHFVYCWYFTPVVDDVAPRYAYITSWRELNMTP